MAFNLTVANIAALSAFNLNNVPAAQRDGFILWVQDPGDGHQDWYYFSASSNATVDNYTIVTANYFTGQWIKGNNLAIRLTTKQIWTAPQVQGQVTLTGATVIPNVDQSANFVWSLPTGSCVLSNPIGSPSPGQMIMIDIIAVSGTFLSFGTSYKFSTTPTAGTSDLLVGYWCDTNKYWKCTYGKW